MEPGLFLYPYQFENIMGPYLPYLGPFKAPYEKKEFTILIVMYMIDIGIIINSYKTIWHTVTLSWSNIAPKRITIMIVKINKNG